MPGDIGKPGDFVVPTQDQLDQLLQFQLSLGRQTNTKIDPASAEFLDETAAIGQRLFHGQDPGPEPKRTLRPCAGCHNNAGATTASGIGLNVDTGVRLAANAPACLKAGAPLDGGFGATPVNMVALCGRTLPSRGDGKVNTQSLWESADTPPFFHNNTAATIEDAVAFYTSATFGASPAGPSFALSKTEVNAVAAFLRELNALDNISSAQRSLEGAQGRPSLGNLLKDPAVREINDAVKVLTRGPAILFAGSRPTQSLLAAVANIRRGQLGQAQSDLNQASARIFRTLAP